MNLKGLFTVLAKILGLYLLVPLVQNIPNVLNSLSLITEQNVTFETILFALFMLASFLWTLFVIWVFTIKTEWITDLLIRDQQLETEFTTFKIHRSTVIQIAVIVIGGLTLVRQIPIFFKLLYNYKVGIELAAKIIDHNELIQACISLALSLFLLYYSKLVTTWIEKLRKR